jgi:hypothetical protein
VHRKKLDITGGIPDSSIVELLVGMNALSGRENSQ